MTQRHRQSKIRAQGFGLVELMVALAVTGLLLTGILEVFLGTRQSHRLISAQSQVQESGRFATSFLHRGLRVAGYPRTDNFLTNWFIYSGANLTANGAGGASDSVAVLYQTDPLGTTLANEPVTDCMGNTTDYDGDAAPDYPPAAMVFPNGYNGSDFYAKDRYLVLPSGNLACLPYDVNDAPRLNGSCTLDQLMADPIGADDCEDHILVEGVDNMQILYGVDTDINADGVANIYQNAAQVGTWNRVVSLRIELLVNSGDYQGLEEDDTSTTYALLDAQTAGPFGDRLTRSVFSTTVTLRNRMP